MTISAIRMVASSNDSNEERYHTVVPAGLTESTIVADLDFETYSEAGCDWDEEKQRWVPLPNAARKGLSVVGAASYTEHPTFEPLHLFYDLKDGLGRRAWRPGLSDPTDLFDHIRGAGLIEAWNVGFERWVWENYCVPVLGWPRVNEHQWRCAMAKSRAWGGPGKLEVFGQVFNLADKKLDGKRLLDKFSMPRNPTKKDPRRRLRLSFDPASLEYEDSLALVRYNEGDIITESQASRLTPDLSSHELRYWQDDQRINRRGVQIDLGGVHDCIAIIEQATHRYGAELRELTGGIEPTEVQQLLGWLHGRSVHLDALDEEAVENALDRTLPSDARRALEIRSLVGSASVKKAYAMRNRVARNGRLHDLYNYHAARTGRPTGEGPQPTNLPKAGPDVRRCGYDSKDRLLPDGGCGRWHGAHTMWCHWCNRVTLRKPGEAREWNPEAMEDALHAISLRSLDWVELLFGEAMRTVAGCLRGLFVAAPGHELISSDYTAIEGVVIAALANEKWRLDVYAGTSSIYLASAARAFGVSLEELEQYRRDTGQHHPLRDKGKRMELGLGFGGWINALRSKQIRYEGTDDELKDAILKWRAASPAIEWLWGGQRKGAADSLRGKPGADRWDRTPEFFGLEGAAIQAVVTPGQWFTVDRLDGSPTGVAYINHNDVLYCHLPTGSQITYHRPRVTPAEKDWRGLALSFEGWNSNAAKGPVGWYRMQLYSGLLAENVTQAVARGKQAGAISRLENSGYPIVMHTYDEVVAEVPEDVGSVEQLEALMTRPDPWNEGWPIKAAGGWRGYRYRKG
jgi:DNA polymerase bacteriophage-type